MDQKKGGFFQIAPLEEGIKYKQFYLPETNILYSRFLCSKGIGEVVDFMPMPARIESSSLVRRVQASRGEVQFRLQCCPRFNYARSAHQAKLLNEKEITFCSEGEDRQRLKLTSTVSLSLKKKDGFAEFTLKEGESAESPVFGLEQGEGSFSACSFWYIECLARAGHLPKAQKYFDEMLSYANHVGLYSEQLSAQGAHLGDFPQAFTHLSLISAAYNLNKILQKR